MKIIYKQCLHLLYTCILNITEHNLYFTNSDYYRHQPFLTFCQIFNSEANSFCIFSAKVEYYKVNGTHCHWLL